MVNRYAWIGAVSPGAGRPATSERDLRADVASVGRMWVDAAYGDLRRAGPDRAVQIRRILDSYVIPWFGPQTSTVGDISYFMVHEWLLNLVGRGEGVRRPGVRFLVDACLSPVVTAGLRKAWPPCGARHMWGC